MGNRGTSNPSTLPALSGPVLSNAVAGSASTSDGVESAQANLPINESVLTGEIDDGLEPLAELPALGDSGGLDDLMPTPGFQYEEDPVDRLRQLIQDRREETVEILRDWMNDGHEENA